jgi:hypothetical protein
MATAKKIVGEKHASFTACPDFATIMFEYLRTAT